jgi:hypothetical protein
MKQLFFIVFFSIVIMANVFAVRPFITDDAAVIGRKQWQLETWALFEKNQGEHWMMLAYGLAPNLEVAIGSQWGFIQNENGKNEFSLAMPLLEAKYLFREYESGKFPGIALATGTFLPMGKGEFVAPGRGAYSFLALTQCFGENEDILIHGNIGTNYLRVNNENQFTSIWGIGTQIRAYKGLHLVAELIAGDPYVPGTGTAYHIGFRHFISDDIQVDASIGQGIAGKEKVPFWLGFGARFVL